MATIFKLDKVSIAYGKIKVIDEVSLELEEGECISILGPNGVGKTTLMRGIMGLVPAEGKILCQGVNLIPLSAHEIAQRKIAYASERGSFFSTMDVGDNLLLSGFMIDEEERKKRQEEIYEIFPILEEREEQQTGSLSGGERKMLTIAMAMMIRPEVLLTDEPTLGLAAGIIKDLESKLIELNDKGISIIVTEQNLDFAKRCSSSIYLLREGKLSDPIPSQDLELTEYVKESYFGE